MMKTLNNKKVQICKKDFLIQEKFPYCSAVSIHQNSQLEDWGRRESLWFSIIGTSCYGEELVRNNSGELN